MNPRQQNKIQEYLTYYHQNSWDKLPNSMCIDSGKPGKSIVFVGSLGGDELGGTIAMIKLHKFLSKNEQVLTSGKLIFILGNPQAFKQGVAKLHDHLNESFIAETTNSYEGKRAATLKEFFASEKPDLVLDLHTSSVGEMRMVQYRKEQMSRMGIMEAISDISYYVAYTEGLIPGSLINYLTDIDIVSFALECGNSKSKKSIGIAFDHLVRTLEHFEMVNQDITIPKMMDDRTVPFIQLFDIREVIEPKRNFRFTDEEIKTGSVIKKGDIYATFEGGYLVAHDDYYMFLPNKQVRRGDSNAGYLCKIYKFNKEGEEAS